MREERRGLVSLYGFYGIMPDVDILLQNFAGVVRLTFVFVGSGGDGHFDTSLRLLKPNGEPLFESPALPIDVQPGRRANIAFNVVPGIQLPDPGTYRVVLLAGGGSVFETTFAVRQGQPADFA